jgi:hypothetical protein
MLHRAAREEADARVIAARVRLAGSADGLHARLRVWKPERGGEQWFCGDSGSSLFADNPSHADPIGVRMRALNGDPGIRSSVRQFVAHVPRSEPVPANGLPSPERTPRQAMCVAGQRRSGCRPGWSTDLKFIG